MDPDFEIVEKCRRVTTYRFSRGRTRLAHRVVLKELDFHFSAIEQKEGLNISQTLLMDCLFDFCFHKLVGSVWNDTI